MSIALHTFKWRITFDAAWMHANIIVVFANFIEHQSRRLET